jgi:uncharacterized protein YndB with AHSA1/START domain
MDDRAEKLSVRYAIEIEAGPEAIWPFIATAEGLLAWFRGAELVELEPHVGGAYLEKGEHGGFPYHLVGEVTVYDPPHRIAFTLRLIRQDGSQWPADTLLTLTLEPAGNTTHVRLDHTGFETLGDDLAARAHQGFLGGWDGSLELLRQLVDDQTTSSQP